MSDYAASLPWSHYETMDTFPTDWNFGSAPPEDQMISYYNGILAQQLAGTIEFSTHTGAQSTNSSYTSIPHSTGYQSPKRIASTSSNATLKKSSTGHKAAEGNATKEQRRREQNRTSQRAYRDRKEKQQKVLETQIAQWQAKHNGLCSSYTEQTAEIQRLKLKVEELTNKIIAVQTELLTQSPGEFDWVPGYDYDWVDLNKT